MACREIVDLTSHATLTYELLDDTWKWRERVVETFEFDSAHAVHARSSYQIRFDASLAHRFSSSEPNFVRVLLPVTTRPKRALIGFDVEAGDQRAYLPRRETLAALQAGYLLHLAGRSTASTELLQHLPVGLLRAICAFTPGVFDAYRTGLAHLVPHLDITRYLRDGLGFKLSWRQVRAFEKRLEPAVDKMLARLDEPRDRRSSSERLLLALPKLETPPASVDEVGEVVEGYVEAIEAAAANDDDAFLLTLAEYGRRWEVIVEAILPVDSAALVRLREDRPLRIRVGGHCTHRLWASDAASHHAVGRVLDPAVMFVRHVQARDPQGRLSLGVWEGQQVDDDAVAVYTSDKLRDDFVDITVRLRPTWAVRAPIVAAQFLAALAIAAAVLVPLHEEKVGRLALLVGPTSFIVALLLVREQTSLAARLQRWPRLRLLGALVVLWLIALRRLLIT